MITLDTQGMFERLREMPPYKTLEGRIPADRFNRFRLSIIRWGSPLRLPLPTLRSLEMYIDEDCWVVLDTAMNDFPVLAWSDFEGAGRDNLHLPVACRITHYHAHAGLVFEAAFQEALEQIDERLSLRQD